MRYAILATLAAALPAAASAQPPLDTAWVAGVSDSEEPWFGRISDAAVDGLGRIWVADGTRKAVVVLDGEGRWVRTIGREGTGPGEFQTVSALRPGGGEVEVFDARLQRVVRFDTAGRHMVTQRMAAGPVENVSKLVRIGPERAVKVRTPRFVRDSNSHEPFTRVFYETPESSQLVARLRSSGVLWYHREEPTPWGVSESGLGDQGDWGVIGDSLLVIVDGYEGVLSWYRLGPDVATPVVETDLGRPGSPRTDAEERRILELARERYGRKLPRDPGLDMPPMRSAAPDLVVSAEGVIWVRHGSRGPDASTWSAWDRDGAVEQLRLPSGLRLLAVDESHELVVAATTSPEGRPLLVALKGR